jgi:hypothetical protein
MLEEGEEKEQEKEKGEKEKSPYVILRPLSGCVLVVVWVLASFLFYFLFFHFSLYTCLF